MDAFGIFRFWRNNAAGADVISEVDGVRNSSDEETDDDDSLFDLAFKSPEKRDEDLTKDYRFIESPTDVFLSKNDLSSPNKPQSPVTTLRSAPKFKVFMLGFKKSSKSETSAASPVNQLSKPTKLEQSSNRFSVKSGAVGVAVGPVFARDNSLRSKMLKESCNYDVVSAEKSVPKYLKLIKPFYVKASSSKTKATGSSTPSASPVTAPVNLSPRKFCEVSRVGSLKIMTRNLVKSRSASAADGAAPPSIRRRDDSLLEQHDGIQGAILHCKRSFTNSTNRERSYLCRASSDTSHEKLRRNSYEEQKRCSI